MLGTSPAFLRYVANLLPSLGQHQVRQTTIHEWLISAFSQQPRLQKKNRLLARLVSNQRQASAADYEAERFKGSKEMGDILGRHVKKLRTTFINQAKDIAVRGNGHADTVLTVQAEEIVRIASSMETLPLNYARARLLGEVLLFLWRFSIQSEYTGFQEFQHTFSETVDEQLAAFWPSVKYSSEYSEVLAGLVQASNGLLPDETATRLERNVAAAKGHFTDTDLAPLLYLDHLLNAHPDPEFQHVVIDEAQDVSPLEVKLLKIHSVNNSFTILGDLRQKVIPYAGITKWTELSVLFDRDDVSRYDSRISYRSTWEITKFCNRILRRIGETSNPPKPFERHAESPVFYKAQSFGEMASHIRDRISVLRDEQMVSIGVLAKWAREARQLYEYLVTCGLTDIGLLSPDGYVTAPVIVCPILLAKGLEFDAVIVAGVHDRNFAGSELDSRLLYVACTRARHRLSLHWFGRLSAVLKPMYVY